MSFEFCSAIIVAGGKGTRVGGNISKQFIKLNDEPIIVHTLKKFLKLSFVDEIIVVLPIDFIDYYNENISKKYHLEKIKVVAGGTERHISVSNGLKQLKQNEIVLIHDGVRPFVSENLIKEIYLNTIKYGACIPGIPIKDTVKSINSNFVDKTINRSNLINVQTPQGYIKKTIVNAYEKFDFSKKIVTDESSILEFFGEKIYVIKGEDLNIKITTKEDIIFGEFILAKLNYNKLT